ALVRSSADMYLVRLLFGLGFDTATEVGLLGLAAVEAARGLSILSVLLLPALFAAGMALIDTADSFLMVGAYGWALGNPLRRRRYNVAVTSLSAFAALAIGTLDLLDRLPHPTALGLSLFALLALVWLAAQLGTAWLPSGIRSGGTAARFAAASTSEQRGIERPRPRAVSEDHEARAAEQHRQLVASDVPDRSGGQMHPEERRQELARQQQSDQAAEEPQDQEPAADGFQASGDVAEVGREAHVDEVLRPMRQVGELGHAVVEEDHPQRQPQQRQR